jgi:hypothetical protein
MTVLQRMATVCLAGFIAWVAWRERPARLRTARVTAVSAAAPWVAHVLLQYQPGALPISTVVMVESTTARGSITVDGLTHDADVLLNGEPSTPLVVHTLVVHRRYGRTIEMKQSFD